MTAPGTRQKLSQMESVRPSAWLAPSIWKAAVAAPNWKACGKRGGGIVLLEKGWTRSLVRDARHAGGGRDALLAQGAHALPSGAQPRVHVLVDAEVDEGEGHADEGDAQARRQEPPPLVGEGVVALRPEQD